MAAEILDKKALVLTIEEGMDTEGKPVYKRYTYSNLKADATVDGLLETAQVIASLYNGPLNEVNVVATSFLYE